MIVSSTPPNCLQDVLIGPVDFRHVFLNMSGLATQGSDFTRAGRTCPAAMGFSFAAGTTDGEGCRACIAVKQGVTPASNRG